MADTFGTYLREIQQYSLLTADEEKALARRIQKTECVCVTKTSEEALSSGAFGATT